MLIVGIRAERQTCVGEILKGGKLFVVLTDRGLSNSNWKCGKEFRLGERERKIVLLAVEAK